MSATVDPNPVLEAPLAQAKSAIQARQWQRASVLLEELVSTQPRAPAEWHRLLVRSYRASRRMEQAHAAASRALSLYPEHGGLLSQAAYNAKVSKDRPAAADLLEALLKVEAPHPKEKTYVRAVEALRQARRFNDAEARGREALDRYPGSAALMSQFAAVAQRQRRWDEAIERLRKLQALEAEPASEKTFLRLATVLRKAERPADAAKVIASGLEHHPSSEWLKAEQALLPQAQALDEGAWRASLDHPAPRRHPYQGLRETAFWNRAVENVYPLDISGWYRKKFDITGLSIATAGSCFAQHIGRHLRQNGYAYVDAEPAPGFLKRQSWLEFGYGMYSARYGNIYTPRQLLQLLQRALGEFTPLEQAWARQNGVVDPFRPTIEPEPFASIDELQAQRDHHLKSVIRMFEKADLFVFTLGLTETWECIADGAVFPVAPGVSGGTWDPQRFRFRNLGFAEIVADMEQVIARARSIKPGLKFLLTVSPVPLMATATAQHVVVATSYSKSVLRAVAGHLADDDPDIDYFPSFEIIGAPVMRAQFYNPDMRTVADQGVEHVMRQFFAQHRPAVATSAPISADGDDDSEDPEEIACDEELLRRFGEKAL